MGSLSSLSFCLSPPSCISPLPPPNVSALRLSISLLLRLATNAEEASPKITAPLVTTYNVLTLLLELLITVITGA
jgi:hypothetical protein